MRWQDTAATVTGYLNICFLFLKKHKNIKPSRFKNSVNYWAGNWTHLKSICLLGKCRKEAWWKDRLACATVSTSSSFSFALQEQENCVRLFRRKETVWSFSRMSAGSHPGQKECCSARPLWPLLTQLPRHLGDAIWEQLLLGHRGHSVYSTQPVLYPQCGVLTLYSCLQEKFLSPPVTLLKQKQNRSRKV